MSDRTSRGSIQQGLLTGLLKMAESYTRAHPEYGLFAFFCFTFVALIVLSAISGLIGRGDEKISLYALVLYFLSFVGICLAILLVRRVLLWVGSILSAHPLFQACVRYLAVATLLFWGSAANVSLAWYGYRVVFQPSEQVEMEMVESEGVKPEGFWRSLGEGILSIVAPEEIKTVQQGPDDVVEVIVPPIVADPSSKSEQASDHRNPELQGASRSSYDECLQRAKPTGDLEELNKCYSEL